MLVNLPYTLAGYLPWTLPTGPPACISVSRESPEQRPGRGTAQHPLGWKSPARTELSQPAYPTPPSQPTYPMPSPARSSGPRSLPSTGPAPPASLPYTLLHPACRRADIRLIGNTHPKRPTLYLPQPKGSQRRPHHSGRTAAPSQPTPYLRPCNQPKSPPLAPRSPPPLVSRPGQPTLYPTTGKLRRQGRHTRAEAKAPRPQPAYPIPQPGQRKEKLLADRAGGDKSPQLPLSLSQHPKSPPCKAR
jgi:hypothetical protein